MDFGVTNKLWEYGINSHTSAMAISFRMKFDKRF